MLSTSFAWQNEKGKCKVNLGSHDKNDFWLPRYRWWFSFPQSPNQCCLLVSSKTNQAHVTLNYAKVIHELCNIYL